MRSLIAAAAASCLACGPLATGELSASEVCRDFAPIAIDASPVDATGTFEHTTRLELPPEVAQPGLDSDLDVELLRLELSAEGLSNLGFVDSVSAFLIQTQQRTEVARYTKVDDAPTQLTLLPTAVIDIAESATEQPAEVTTVFTGQLPRTPWTLKLRGCYRSALSVKWTP